MVRANENKVTIKPLAGTSRRGKTKAEDLEISKNLLSDKKEIAEHMVLLDLGRNDVGVVSLPNSVKVEKKMEIEYYSHVMHISSTVTGVLNEEKTMVDVFCAGFPAGTVSGGPKIKSMQIINVVEKINRSFYGGCVGYISKTMLETCISLRTSLIKDGVIYFQAGAGVVYDSDPEKEYEECKNKASALLKAYIKSFLIKNA
jgi:anthranilate synthase component 1